jgi:putative Holliday junction resolvase
VVEGRSIGLDVGDVRIGVAVSDPLGMIATPHDVIQAQNPEADANAVKDLVDELGARRIVVGLPLLNSGEVGSQAEKVLAFVEVLKEAVAVPVETIDERFTTVIAQRAMTAAGTKKKKRKGVVDQLAAQQILQTWLDRAGA